MSENTFILLTIWSLFGTFLYWMWQDEHLDVQPIWKTVVVLLLSGPIMWVLTAIYLAIVIPIGTIRWLWKTFLEI